MNGTLFSDGNRQSNNFQLNNGDRILVRRNAQQIEWMRGGQLLCAAPIPNRISNAPLFPVLWILDDGNKSNRNCVLCDD
jgi:hypothetical protein